MLGVAVEPEFVLILRTGGGSQTCGVRVGWTVDGVGRERGVHAPPAVTPCCSPPGQESPNTHAPWFSRAVSLTTLHSHPHS